ncbi:MAG: HAD family phosphatase [Bacteroidales bacterium]|nr:HAD family phosphatase [Bacteroidales bacterium]
MAKAIVFDIGGVLVGLDMERCIRAFRQRLGFERITELLDPFHQKGIYGEMEAGEVSADDFRAYILAESRPGCRPEDVDLAMKELLAEMPEDTVRTVRDLSARYPLYLLSNNNAISMGHIYALFREKGIEPGTTFRDQFISYQMRMLKPSRAIYDEAARRIGLSPEEILFIDDSPTNVRAAQEAGWQARLYVPGTELSALLKDC